MRHYNVIIKKTVLLLLFKKRYSNSLGIMYKLWIRWEHELMWVFCIDCSILNRTEDAFIYWMTSFTGSSTKWNRRHPFSGSEHILIDASSLSSLVAVDSRHWQSSQLVKVCKVIIPNNCKYYLTKHVYLQLF